MLTSVVTIITGMLAASALALPAPSPTSELEPRETVNVPWTFTGYTTACSATKCRATTPEQKCNAVFAVGAPDAYISGFYGFSVRCNVPINALNYTVCANTPGAWRVDAKVETDNEHGNQSKISLVNTQIDKNIVRIAAGSEWVTPSDRFTIAPTDIRIGL
ncbi:hypothetical protein GGS26DRAFT_473409 [Hypomontagnella submonticulosa]|nr:hypothetical protein GGS26DRAFT_473409 [Hypomontagnella submonticulosa]